MKQQLFKNPQKKGKYYISQYNDKCFCYLTNVKIYNINSNNNDNIIIDVNISDKEADIIKNMDELAINTIKENYNEWFDEDEDNIINAYINSYIEDTPLNLILSNKINTDLFINDDEKSCNEIINYLLLNKNNKDITINVNIVYLGIFIKNDIITNKWGIKSLYIDNNNTSTQNDLREEIEEEWKYDVIKFEKDTKNYIIELENKIKLAKNIYEDIINEPNIKLWENKLEKLKMVIFRK